MNESYLATPLVLLCLCIAAYLGLRLRRILPEGHFKGDAGDSIKLATGLMATLVALVLSLLISSANNVRNTVETEYTQSLASIVLLDRDLAGYGPETKDIRRLLREATIRRFSTIWPDEQFGATKAIDQSADDRIEPIEARVLRLKPADAAQTWYLNQALQILAALAQNSWTVQNQAVSNTLPMPLLVVLVAWTAIIFVSFGLFAEPNHTVYATLFLCALATAVAVFMILELNNPFAGLIQLSSGAAHATIAELGR
jgi:hypothetical protein